jgi:broad specificity phosphatase PhoE
LKAFEQATQHLAARTVHVEPERDHVIDDDMRRQIATANAALAAGGEDLMHFRRREGFGQHPQADEIGDPAPRWKSCRRPCHARSSQALESMRDLARMVNKSLTAI